MNRERIEQAVEKAVSDRVYVVEDAGVWFSGMNAHVGRVVETAATELQSEGFAVDLARDEHGGFFLPVKGEA